MYKKREKHSKGARYGANNKTKSPSTYKVHSP